MDSFDFDFDIEKMAQETMSLSYDFNPDSNDQEEVVETQSSEDVSDYLDQYPETPGLVYWVEKGVGTFCVRAIPTIDIQFTFYKIFEEKDDSISALKLDRVQGELKELFYFETSSFELAQFLWKEVANKRFPWFEDLVCNLTQIRS